MNPPIDRAAFDLEPQLVYLNNAAIGVLPKAGREAIIHYAQSHAQRGVLGVATYEMRLSENRARLARFLGAGADEVAFVRNTAEAANILARGLQLQEGDEILTNDNEFGSNALPWLALRKNGVRVNVVQTARERMTPEVLERHLSPQTKLVTLSWVSFMDGYRHDLAALANVAHGHGALIAVDVIQGVGAFPFSMHEWNLDAVYGGAQKWLLAEPGLGYLCVRAHLLDSLHVALPGWRSLENIWNFLDYEQPFCAGAARFEAGTPNLIGIAALMESVDLLEKSDLILVAQHIQGMVSRLRDGLLSLGAEIAGIAGADCASGILTYRFPGVDPLVTGQYLARAGIVTTNRPHGVRISPHGYNTQAEIELVLEVMRMHVTRR